MFYKGNTWLRTLHDWEPLHFFILIYTDRPYLCKFGVTLFPLCMGFVLLMVHCLRRSIQYRYSWQSIAELNKKIICLAKILFTRGKNVLITFDWRRSLSAIHHRLKYNQAIYKVCDIHLVSLERKGKSTSSYSLFFVCTVIDYGAKICWFCIY